MRSLEKTNEKPGKKNFSAALNFSTTCTFQLNNQYKGMIKINVPTTNLTSMCLLLRKEGLCEP
jgi:hypothetical protein